MKHVLATGFALLLCSAVVYADLRYTTHTEVRMIPVPTTANPAFTQIATLLQGMVPPGDTKTYLSAEAARIEPADSGAGQVILFRADGEFVLDPATRTYWRMPALRGVLANRLSGASSERFRLTGKSATLAGLEAEQITFTTSIPLPVTPPVGFPTALTMEGELWVTNAHTSYSNALSRLAEIAGPSGNRPQGLVLRQILRNPQFGYEVEYSVSELVETASAPRLFEIPEDYQEVHTPPALTAPPF